jgi:hypothetical protein
MVWKLVTTLLVLLNAAVIGSQIHLVRSADRWIEERRGLDARIEDERASLRRQRAELAALSAELSRQVENIASAGNDPEATTNAEGAEDQNFDGESRWYEIALEPFHERPDPAAIPPLSPEELEALWDVRRSMPVDLNDAVLIHGDVETVLEDAHWNPKQRKLSAQERGELARLLSDYRYFARLSIMERTMRGVLPEIPKLRELGAFLEYAESEAPPAVDGVKISHAERSDRPGYRRIYYFTHDAFPALYHQQRVEEERSLETFVRIYQLINPEG